MLSDSSISRSVTMAVAHSALRRQQQLCLGLALLYESDVCGASAKSFARSDSGISPPDGLNVYWVTVGPYAHRPSQHWHQKSLSVLNNLDILQLRRCFPVDGADQGEQPVPCTACDWSRRMGRNGNRTIRLCCLSADNLLRTFEKWTLVVWASSPLPLLFLKGHI